MKKHLILLLSLLVLPSLALAAFDDATFTTDTVIQLGSTNLNVSGASAVLASLAVTDSDFTATMSPGSSLVITSADRKLFTTSVSATGVNITGTCESSNSTLSLIYPTGSGSAITVTATPSGTCATAPSTSTGTGSGSSGGGGGGGSSSSITTATITKPTTTTTTTSPVTTPAVTPTTTSSPAPATVSSVVGVGASVAATRPVFTQPLTNGSRSSQVIELQKLLNSDPATRVSLSGSGSPGKETTLIGPATIVAVKKFQIKYNIAKPGNPGFGFVGPKTRAKLNEIARLGKGGAAVQTPAPAAVVAPRPVVPAPAAQASQSEKLKALLDQIAKLQAQLKAQQ